MSRQTLTMFTAKECTELLERYSQLYNDNDTVTFGIVDPELAEQVRMKLALPDGQFVSSQFYFNRYNAGDRISEHKDGHKRERNSRSIKTVLIYLNGPPDFEGGNTVISGGTEIVPEAGKIYLMDQDILHKAAVVTKGVKYVVRGDLMLFSE